MDYLKIALILSAVVTNIFLGCLTLSKNSKSIVNRTLAGFAGIFALWSVSLFFYDYPLILSSLIWIKITYLIVVFGIIGFMFHLGFIFPDGKSKPPLIGQVFYLIFASILGYSLLFTDSFVREVIISSSGKQTILGNMYIPFIIYDCIFGFWGMGLLIRKYLHAKGRMKAQLKYLFSGLALFIITVLLLDSATPLISGDSSYFSISTVGSLFFVGFTVYAIIKHRLLDIRMALQGVLAFTFTTIILSTICFLGAMGYWLIIGTPFKYEVIIVVTIISILLSLFFNKIVLLSRLIVSKLTSQPFYDFEKTVLNMSLNLTTTLETDQLIDNLCNLFTNFLGVSDIAFVLKNIQKSDYSSPRDKYSVIRKMGFDQRLNFLDDGILVSYVEKNPQMLILEEIGLVIERSNHEAEKYYLRELYTHMEYSNISLILPLVAQKQLLGIVILGSKKSGDSFTVQDIDLLTTAMSQFSNALANAISYAKIKRFNITLGEEVSKATTDLKYANDRLKDLDKLKDDFVSVASHELRTPMTAIKSYAWMALHKSDVSLSQRLEKYLVRILMSTERLINLVNELLNISRIESGRIEINPESVDMISLCKDIADEVYYSKSAEKNMQIALLEQKIPRVFADPEKLREVFLNIMGNAVKFSPNGGKITISFFTDGKTLETSVSDEGPGISREDLGKLFQKFSRLDSTYTAAATTGGTGLGLYIAKSLINLMHGRIWASSEGLGKGAKFSFSLPVANEEALKHAKDFEIKAQGEAKPLEPVAI